MSSDESNVRDEVDVQVQAFGEALVREADRAFSGENVTRQSTRPGAVMQSAPAVPDRPADGAPKAKWVDYVVALGADRRFVTEDTEHHDANLGEAVTEPGLSRDELIDLADRLGG